MRWVVQVLNVPRITTRFYWPPPPGGIIAGYTAPLVRWVDTVIEGLTSEPIVLRGHRSQTCRPEHHNIGENFIFAPQEEEGIAPALLAELDDQDIRWIHVLVGGPTTGTFRYYRSCELALACACGPQGPDFIRGDCNDDSEVDLSDAVCALSWLFLGGQPPGCLAAANANGDDAVDLSDPVWALEFLFLGGPPPAPPFPGCGPGQLPADDDLGCQIAPQTCPSVDR